MKKIITTEQGYKCKQFVV